MPQARNPDRMFSLVTDPFQALASRSQNVAFDTIVSGKDEIITGLSVRCFEWPKCSSVTCCSQYDV